MEWTTIESDPAVFTSLVEQIGVKGVQVEELWDLSNLESLNRRFHLHGLIFLFKYRTDIDATSALAVENVDAPESLFFASQVITNACATQAILGVLLNVETFRNEDGGSKDAEGKEREQTIGETLTELKQFTADFPPELKGLALSNSEKIFGNILRLYFFPFHRICSSQWTHVGIRRSETETGGVRRMFEGKLARSSGSSD